jgi:PPP family 3-phenylpropionic acid transporter
MWWLMASIGALFPILPLYCSALGLSSSAISVLLAVNATTAMICGQLVGYLADIIPSRRRLLLLSTLWCSPLFALYPLLPPTLPWQALGIALISIVYSQRVAVFNSVVFSAPKGEELFGRIRLCGSAGYAVMAVVLGAIASNPNYGPGVMWTALVLCELLFAVSLLWVRETARREARTAAAAPSFREAQKLLFANRLIPHFLLFVFLFQVVCVPLHFMQVLYLKAIGASALVATASLAVAATAEMIVFFFGNSILQRFRLINLLALVPLSLALRFGLMFVLPNAGVIVAASVLHMFGFGLAYLCSVVFMNREVPPELKSSGQTLFAAIFSFFSGLVGNLAAAGLLQILENQAGFTPFTALRVTYAIGAICALLSLLAWVPMRRLMRDR